MKLALKTLILFSLTLVSCVTKSNKNEDLDLALNISKIINNKQTSNTNSKQYFTVKDYNYNIIGAYPYPSNWFKGSVLFNSISAQNNSGAVVYLPKNKYYKTDKLKRKHISHLTNTKTIEKFIKTEVNTTIDSLGFKLINQFKIPELDSMHTKYSLLKFSLYPPKKEAYTFIATEWENDKNESLLILINQHIKKYDDKTTWSYTTTQLNAPKSAYKSAKEDFISSLKNYTLCYHTLFKDNQSDIWNYTLGNRNTCVYYTVKQEKERNKRFSDAKQRCATYEYGTYEEYIKRLKIKGFNTTNELNFCEKSKYEQKIDSLIKLESDLWKTNGVSKQNDESYFNTKDSKTEWEY